MSTNNTVARSEFVNAKPVYFPPIDNRWSNVDALRKASKTSWFKANDGLWVKMVSTGDIPGSGTGTTESLQVSR